MLKRAIVPTIAAAGFLAMPATASADELSANFGWVSNYIYRGFFQETSSAFAGIDYEPESGFYIGVWGADVGDGLETDLYFGYGGESGDFSWSVGATGYFYTDDFDDTYKELNLGIGYGIFSLDVALGEWDGFGASEDYSFASITLAPEKGPYFTLGAFGRDFDGEYFEIGYGREVGGLDLSVAMTYSDNIPVSRYGSSKYALVFGISKTIGLGGR